MEEVNNPKDSLPEGYIKHLKQTGEFIANLEKEEYLENRKDNMENIANRMKLDRIQTEVQKTRLIKELKEGGLGAKMKENPSEIIIIKRPFHQRVWRSIKKMLGKL